MRHIATLGRTVLIALDNVDFDQAAALRRALAARDDAVMTFKDLVK